MFCGGIAIATIIGTKMKKTPKPNLKIQPPFSGLSQHGRNYIQRHLRWVEFPRHTTIIQEGRRGNFMVFVGYGEIEISSVNRETVILHPGENMGEGMLRYGVPSSFNAIAKTDVGLWVIKRYHWLVANSLSTESESNGKFFSTAARIPLWMKTSFISILLVLFFLGPLIPQFTATQLKAVSRDTDYPAKAVDILQWLLLFKPDSPQIQEALGYSHYLQGENSEAVNAFRKAISLDVNLATAQNNLGVALTDQQQSSEAIEHLLIAVELDPSSADYYFNLGDAYLTNNDLSNAADAYQRAYALDPYQLEARSMWAGIALENGELDQAESAWEQVLEIRPDHAYSNKGIGFVKVLKGRYGQALPYLEHALEIDSQDDRTRYYLGLALYALGNPEEAAGQFEKLILVSSDPAVIDLASNQLRLMGP